MSATTTVLYDAPGPRTRARIRLQSIVGGLALAALTGLVLWRLADQGQLAGERWRILGEPAVIRTLLVGLRSTLQAAAVAMVLSLVAGLLLAVGRLSENRLLQGAVRGWIELFRGLPLLLVIFFLYLGAPSVGVRLNVFWSLVLGLALYNSAVIAEVVRAGVLSLPRGQREAALALGLTRGQTLRLVLLPQAVRIMLPALISQVVTLLKDTSLGFVIAYSELLRTGRNVVEFLGGSYSLPVYTAIAVVYIAINMALSSLARWLDRRQGRVARGGGDPGTAGVGRGAAPALADEAA